MAEPYIGEIRMFAGNFAPAGWKFCNGELLPIAENEALFALIGTVYGGDGQQTFALPDLRGRIPIHVGGIPGGAVRALADAGGTEEEQLLIDHLPAHMHRIATSAVASKTSPVANLPGDTGANFIYTDGEGAPIASPDSTSQAGGTQPHTNLMPFLCVSFIIATAGIFPPKQ